MYYEAMKINKAKRKQEEFSAVLSVLGEYATTDQKYIQAKNRLLENAKSFYKEKEKIIEGFKNKIFPIYHDDEDSRFENSDEDDIYNIIMI